MKRTDRRRKGIIECIFLWLCLSFGSVCEAQEYTVTPMSEVYYVMYRVPFYATPDLMSEQVGELAPQTPIEITGVIGNDWYQILVADVFYYVQKNYIACGFDGVEYVTENQYHGETWVLPEGLTDIDVCMFVDEAIKAHVGTIDCRLNSARTTYVRKYILAQAYGNPLKYQYSLIQGMTTSLSNHTIKIQYSTTILEESYVEQFVQTYLPTVNNGSNYNKIKAVHDFICKAVNYDENSFYGDGSNQHAAHAVVNGKMVDEGYAELFQRFMDKMGIPCYMVTGVIDEQEHIWNVVYLDGLWYHLDCTWADQDWGIFRGYFLVGQQKMKYNFELNYITPDQLAQTPYQ